MTDTIYSSPLLERVRRLVIERPRSCSLQDLSEVSGMTTVWLSGFQYGRFPNPSAIAVEKLYVHLTGKQLIND